jgi:Rrf2 family protein
MILSRSQQYGLMALIDLASRPDEFVLCRDLADKLDTPFAYLCKLMQQFAHAGLVHSARGRGGGYRLAKPAAEINIRQIMAIIDGGSVERECLLGLQTCADDHACALHCDWRPVKDGLLQLLDHQTLDRIAGQASPLALSSR